MKKIFIKRKYSHRQKRFKNNFHKKFFNKKKRFSQTKRIQKDFHKKKRFSQMILSKNKCVNRGSIGGLIGVHVSSIVKWGHQDNFKTDFFFFYEKVSYAQKAPKHKTSNFHLLRSLCAQKTVAFVAFCLLIFVLLVNVCLWVFLCI